MRGALHLVTDWLLCASEMVAPEYLQLPVAGAEEPEYRERVYCYELYHRWRCHWPERFPFSLSGELDKNKHPLIRGERKPDFLVHIPGEMTNLLVVEVKPRNADRARMRDDLKKLTTFRRDLPSQHGRSGNYDAAYLWLYGLPVVEWPALRAELLSDAKVPKEIDPALVSCFIHERAGVKAIKVTWK